MWFEHAGLSPADAERVARLMKNVVQRGPAPAPRPPQQAAPKAAEPELTVGVRPQRDSRSRGKPQSAEHVLAELHAQASKRSGLDDYDLLGIDRSADDEDVRRAYLELSKRFHPHRFARHRSEEVTRLATDLYVQIQAAYGRLTHSHRVPQQEGAKVRRVVRAQLDVRVSEAVKLLDYRQYDAAIEALEAVLDDDPEHEGASVWLITARARKHKSLGRLEAAADSYRAVLELSPEHAEALTELEQIAAKTQVPLLKRWLSRGE
jgi:tetratricopeptide (TPR) repeat protein